MLGRRPTAASSSNTRTSSSTAKNGAKKRKWQESDDEDQDEKITKADMEKFKATMREEERQEQLARERHERREKEEAKRRQRAEEEEEKKKREEEAKVLAEAEEAKKKVEAERKRLENAVGGFASGSALPMDDSSVMPAGVHPGKEHLYKTSYCKRWELGSCNFGSACHFAHGQRELRRKAPSGSPQGTLSMPLPQDAVRPQPNMLAANAAATQAQIEAAIAQAAQVNQTQEMFSQMQQVVGAEAGMPMEAAAAALQGLLGSFASNTTGASASAEGWAGTEVSAISNANGPGGGTEGWAGNVTEVWAGNTTEGWASNATDGWAGTERW